MICQIWSVSDNHTTFGICLNSMNLMKWKVILGKCKASQISHETKSTIACVTKHAKCMTLSILEAILPRQRSHDTLAFSTWAKNWCVVAFLVCNYKGLLVWQLHSAQVGIELLRDQCVVERIWPGQQGTLATTTHTNPQGTKPHMGNLNMISPIRACHTWLGLPGHHGPQVNLSQALTVLTLYWTDASWKDQFIIKLSQHLLVLPSVQSARHCLSWRPVWLGKEIMTIAFSINTGVQYHHWYVTARGF